MSQTITVQRTEQTITVDPATQVVTVARPEQVVTVVPSGPPGPPGPQGGAGGARFVHTQASPTAQWTVTHGLGTYPNIVLLADSNPGEPVHTDVVYLTSDTVQITWPSPESGKAYLS